MMRRTKLTLLSPVEKTSGVSRCGVLELAVCVEVDMEGLKVGSN
jgi:hypothetical protein